MSRRCEAPSGPISPAGSRRNRGRNAAPVRGPCPRSCKIAAIALAIVCIRPTTFSDLAVFNWRLVCLGQATSSERKNEEPPFANCIGTRGLGSRTRVCRRPSTRNKGRVPKDAGHGVGRDTEQVLAPVARRLSHCSSCSPGSRAAACFQHDALSCGFREDSPGARPSAARPLRQFQLPSLTFVW